MPVFSSAQLLLYCVGCAKANFYIGLFEQVSYSSDQWAVVCKGYPFTSLCCYFLLLLFVGLFLFLLEKLTVLSYSRNSPRFMQPESSLPHVQVAIICPYLEPGQSTPCSPFKLPKILLPIYTCVFQDIKLTFTCNKIITRLAIFPANISRTVMMLCSMIGGYQLYSCYNVVQYDWWVPTVQLL